MPSFSEHFSEIYFPKNGEKLQYLIWNNMNSTNETLMSLITLTTWITVHIQTGATVFQILLSYFIYIFIYKDEICIQPLLEVCKQGRFSMALSATERFPWHNTVSRRKASRVKAGTESEFIVEGNKSSLPCTKTLGGCRTGNNLVF